MSEIKENVVRIAIARDFFATRKVILRIRKLRKYEATGVQVEKGKTIILAVCMAILIAGGVEEGCSRQSPVVQVEKREPESDARYRKDMEEIRKTMRGDIKIRLKKDAKGSYSWEISGKDPYEIIKTDGVLRKKISTDQPG